MAHARSTFRSVSAPGLAEREEAILAALSLGIALHKIEEYLDWLDTEVFGSCSLDWSHLLNALVPREPARSPIRRAPVSRQTSGSPADRGLPRIAR